MSDGTGTDPVPASPGSRAGEVARVFLKLGTIGFGGPLAHIALMREELVGRRRWLSDTEFGELVGVTNLIPGPNSTELAILCGYRRAGPRGLLIAGACFIAPAVTLVGLLAWAYERHGTDPALVDLRYGILPVVLAVVAHALYGLGRATLTSPGAAVIAAAAFAAFLSGVHELVILAGAGALAVLWANTPTRPNLSAVVALPATLATAGAPVAVSLPRLFATFLETGSLLYGSGYVLLAFLQRNLVDQTGWLTSCQLLDAVAVGQITPGPVFATATFVGWLLAGPAGAAVATVGIFLPSFVFVALAGRIVVRLRNRPAARAALGGLTAGSLGLLAGVLVQLVGTAVSDVVSASVAIVTLVVAVGTRVNPAWLIGAGAVVGALRALAR